MLRRAPPCVAAYREIDPLMSVSASSAMTSHDHSRSERSVATAAFTK